MNKNFTCITAPVYHPCNFLDSFYFYTYLNLVSATFYQIFIFHQMLALQKLWKMFFISSKKLFTFLRYSIFCISVFPSFFSVSHCFRGWSKKNRKVYDVIKCLNENLRTHFVWYFEKEIRYGIETLSIDRKIIMQKMWTKS